MLRGLLKEAHTKAKIPNPRKALEAYVPLSFSCLLSLASFLPVFHILSVVALFFFSILNIKKLTIKCGNFFHKTERERETY